MGSTGCCCRRRAHSADVQVALRREYKTRGRASQEPFEPVSVGALFLQRMCCILVPIQVACHGKSDDGRLVFPNGAAV